MIPLSDVLGAPDREHLRRILARGPSSPGTSHSKAAEFLRDDSYAEENAAESLKALSQADRERVLSDLVWRVTCWLDGSMTSVVGTNTFALGKGFSAVQSEQGGRDIFCLTI